LSAGIAAGIAGAVALGRLLGTQLFNVPPADPISIAAVTAAFAICGFIAIVWPARAAAALDPARVLNE
jgi:hypothetical protein